MPRPRPPLVLTAAILNFGFGTLFLLCGCLGTFGQVMIFAARSAPPSATPQNPAADMAAFVDRQLPGHNLFEIFTCAMILLGGLFLIADGIGLLYMQRWARLTAIGYGAVTILFHLAYVFFKLVFVYPVAYKHMADNLTASGNANTQAAMVGFNIGFFFSLGSTSGLPILHAAALLLIMVLPSVAAAFAGREVPSEAPPSWDDGWSARGSASDKFRPDPRS